MDQEDTPASKPSDDSQSLSMRQIPSHNWNGWKQVGHRKSAIPVWRDYFLMCLIDAARTQVDRNVLSDMIEEFTSIIDNRKYRANDNLRYWTPKKVRSDRLEMWINRFRERADEEGFPNEPNLTHKTLNS